MFFVGTFAGFFLSVVVVTSNYDLYFVAQAVADPSFEIYYIVDETVSDPYEFKPQDFHIRILNRADVFIHTGTFERRWLGEVLWKARNPKIVEGQDGHIDISKYVKFPNGSNCFILRKEQLKKVAVVLSGYFQKLSPSFSREFYEKKLSDFFSSVDEFFNDLSTAVSPYISKKFAIYSPCMKILAEEFGKSPEFIVKKSDSEFFSFSAARDTAEIMKRTKTYLLISSTSIERGAEIGFMSSEIFILKVPAHLGKANPDFKSLIKNIKFVGDMEKFMKIEGEREAEERKNGAKRVVPSPEEKIISVPEEKPPAELQKYGYITSKYTSVILRDRPSPFAGQAGRISGGERVLILDRQNEWVKVTDGKSVGWVRISVVSIEE